MREIHFVSLSPRSKLTVPIHYNTWPVISANPSEFAELCKPDQVEILKPGENYVV